jgi:hypothetical protein
VTFVIFAGLRMIRGKSGNRQSSAVALAGAVGVALAGAVVWGLVAMLIHKQLSLLGLAIGVAVGRVVARFRAGHLPTIIAGAVIAVAGCALGTFLGQVFLLLNQGSSLSDILSNLSALLRDYPTNVGALGLLFYAIAAYGAIRVPLRTQRRSASPPGPAGYQPDGSGPDITPTAMTGPSGPPADSGTGVS